MYMKKSIITFYLITKLSLLFAQGGEWHIDVSASHLKVTKLTNIFFNDYLFTKTSVMPTFKYQYLINKEFGLFIDLSYSEQYIDQRKFLKYYNVEAGSNSPITCHISTIGIVYRTNILKKLSFDLNFGMGFHLLAPYYIYSNYFNNTIDDFVPSSISSNYSSGIAVKGGININYPIYKSNLFLKAGFSILGSFQNQSRHVGFVNNVKNEGYSYDLNGRVDYIFNNFYLGLFVKL